jgi:predicted dehydrogenase
MKKLFLFVIPFIFTSCGPGNSKKEAVNADSSMVRLITVDPGHFHAALVQKTMYAGVSPDVHVYAPEGPDLKLHLSRINSYNSRSNNPTSWNEIVYTGPDFFEKMISDKAGNVVVLAGNNRKKGEYITRSVNAGMNVLSDKPMIIRPEDFSSLETAFRTAGEKGILVYDIMTERFEITTILQKLLSLDQEIFGTLEKGSKDKPSVSKISVHHFSKIVSGNPLIRPSWYFDVEQQGEGIVDVTTHLVDLIQWECFPEQSLTPSDVEMLAARRWPTKISLEEFKGVTGLEDFPDFLKKDVRNGILNVFSNGEMTYKLKDIFVNISVEWKYKAPPGGGDTHFSLMHGTKCDLTIKQSAAEKFIPTLYVENIRGTKINDFEIKLKDALGRLPYDSLTIDRSGSSLRIIIPSKFRVSHEEHFSQVAQRYLQYLNDGKLPEWEVPNMITKYYTTTAALKLAKGQ